LVGIDEVSVVTKLHDVADGHVAHCAELGDVVVVEAASRAVHEDLDVVALEDVDGHLRHVELTARLLIRPRSTHLRARVPDAGQLSEARHGAIDAVGFRDVDVSAVAAGVHL
jgi:hypothetical protein